MKFKRGDIVIYQYLHTCGWSSWPIARRAIFIKEMSPKKNQYYELGLRAKIQVEGNKHPSYVQMSEIGKPEKGTK